MTTQIGAPLPFSGLEGPDTLLAEADGRAVWTNVVDQLDIAVQQYQKFGAQTKALQAQGVNMAPVEARAVVWVDAVNKLFSLIVQIIKSNPTIQSVIDSIAGVGDTITKAVGFAEVRIGAWQELVNLLQPPAKPNGLGFFAAAVEIAGSVLTNPAVWSYVATTLRTLTPWVGSYLVSSNVSSALNTAAEEAKAKGTAIEVCLDRAAKLTTAPERQSAINLCAGATTTTSPWMWLAFGGLAAGGAIYYFQNKPTMKSRSVALSGLSRLSSRRRRR